MIKTENLQKVFRTEEVETHALQNVSLDIAAGEFVAIMGPSGCGKSTLLNILGLLDNPTGGRYFLNGEDVSLYPERQRTRLRKGVIGFVFQSFNLADEPTGNLDSKNGKEVMSMLTEQNAEGTTVIMVTHSQHDAGYAVRVINLFDGEIVTEVRL